MKKLSAVGNKKLSDYAELRELVIIHATMMRHIQNIYQKT